MKFCPLFRVAGLLCSYMIFLTIGGLKAQPPNFQWKLVLDGYNDVYVADIAVDSKGNTYAGINYTSLLTIPILNIKLPGARHVYGLILKVDPDGKPLWAHSLISDFDNRIKDISLAPNGDVLICGFGDGLLCFPGLKDTLKAGLPPKLINYYTQRQQGFYAARYTPDGERKWVQYWNCAWGEGLSIAANKRGEVYFSYYHTGIIRQNDVVIDSFVESPGKDTKISIAKFDSNGKLLHIQPIGYSGNSTLIHFHNITFDHEDNMLIYGSFGGKLMLTEKYSLTNKPYLESSDGYLAKYNPNDEFLWAKQIGGRNTQRLQDIAVAADNSIYAVGTYNMECTIGDGITTMQQSKYEWKSGNSFVFIHFFDDGEIDFARYTDNLGYNSYVSGQSIAITPKGNIHIVGSINDTLDVEGMSAATSAETAYYSIWNGNRLQSLDVIADAAEGFLSVRNVRIGGRIFVCASEYYGKEISMTIGKKKQVLPSKDYGRVTILCGGTIPETPNRTEPLSLKDSIRKQRMQRLEMLLACTKAAAEPAPNLWFPNGPVFGTVPEPTESPCGNKVKDMEASLFPNPALNELHIRLAGIQGAVRIDIFSETGRLMLSHRAEVAVNEPELTFGIAELNTGIYFVRISHNNYEKALRLVKVR